jgi:hypothetical protein
VDHGRRAQSLGDVGLEGVAVPDVLLDGPDALAERRARAVALEGGAGGRRRRPGDRRIAGRDAVEERQRAFATPLEGPLGVTLDARAGGHPEGRLAVAWFLPGGHAVVDADLETREGAVVDRRRGEVLQFPGDVVGEPPERSTGVGNLTVAPNERLAVEQARQFSDRRRGVDVADRFEVGTDLQPRDRVGREVAPPRLAAGGLEVDAAGTGACPPVGAERVPDPNAVLDGNARSLGAVTRGLHERRSGRREAWITT